MHLWWLELDGVPAAALAALAPAEAGRAARIVDPGAARERAAARAALRAVLGGYLGCPPAEVPLAVEAGGRPFAPGGPRFSLSHAGGWVLLAVAASDVGVDVEPLRPRRWGPVAARFLGSEGTAAVAAAADPEVAFLRAWCRLEAWAKARGSGIRFGLEAPDGLFRDLGEGTEVEDGPRWFRVVDLEPAPGHVAALAVAAPATRLAWIRRLPV